MGSSFYLQLAPYLLLEYTYGGSDTTFISNIVKLARIQNTYTGEMQLLNTSPALNITQNVLDTSAANIGGVKWAFLDKDVPTPYISIDPKLVYTDLSGIFTSQNIVYDRVRLHFVSGYRLEDIEGLIAQVYVREAQTSKNSIFANNVYLKSDDRDILNPKPIMLGDRMYDRYVEFLVPSLKEANTDFYANPTNAISLGNQYTSNYRGFLFNSAIYVKVFEISRVEKQNGNLFFHTSDVHEVNVNQEDTYSLLSANIEEASDGDYFVYYPTYNGNFIEDFIADLNTRGGDHVVLNDIDVYEQIGADSVLTYSFTQAQLGEFDQPLEYRPLVKYSDVAVAFHIDYTVRIYNRENGYQLIRKASTTSFNPRKYGKNIEKIALAQQSYPMKVYNKVYGASTVTFNSPEATSGFNTVYVPVFFDAKRIVVQTKSVLAEGADPTDPNFAESGIYFGQGDARIYLSDFDSYFKFSVFQVNSPPKKIDLSASVIQLAFKDPAGNMVKIPALDSTADNAYTDGEVVFKVSGSIKKKILTDNTLKSFYLISSNTGSGDTILYTGSVDKIENIGKESERLKTLATSVVNSASKSSASAATTTSTGSTGSGGVLSNSNKNASILDTLTANNKGNVNKVKTEEPIQPPSIPGYSVDQNASSLKTGVKPVAQTKDSISKTDVLSKLSQQSGTSISLKK